MAVAISWSLHLNRVTLSFFMQLLIAFVCYVASTSMWCAVFVLHANCDVFYFCAMWTIPVCFVLYLFTMWTAPVCGMLYLTNIWTLQACSVLCSWVCYFMWTLAVRVVLYSCVMWILPVCGVLYLCCICTVPVCFVLYSCALWTLPNVWCVVCVLQYANCVLCELY